MDKKVINLTSLKLGLLGDSSVGKTCILEVYNNNEFQEQQIATIGVDYHKTKILLENNKEINLYLWDTAGQERFRASDIKSLRGAHGIILVFSFTDRSSFEHLEIWLREIRDNFDDDTVIVLFGNKIDFEKNYWAVTSEEAKEYVQTKNLVLFETSAKTKQGINEGFAYIANKAYLIAEKREKKKNNIIIKNENKANEKCVGKKKSK